MFVVGQRIKERRLALGLSQQQIGRKDMSRAFISLVEQGKTQPSRRNLEIIATRLEKPPEYFLVAKKDGNLHAVTLLEKTANRLMEQKNWEEALLHIGSALHLVEPLGEPKVELRLRMTEAFCSLFSGDYAKALELYESLMETCKALNEREILVEVYYRSGMACQVLEDYQNARRYYTRAIQLASEKKTLLETKASALINLGSCHSVLGDLEGAAEAYKEAAASILPSEFPRVYADSCNGLSICLRKAGRLQESGGWALKAISVYEKINQVETLNARHGLAEIHLEMGDADQALQLLNECLHTYSQMGLVRRQAGVLESLASHYLKSKEFERVLTLCQEGLDLLDLSEDGILRGVLYRYAGQAHYALGNHGRSRELLRFSLDLFRRMKATAELDRTSAVLRDMLT